MPLRARTDRKLQHIRSTLPLHVRCQVNFIIQQMKVGQLPEAMRYTPLRHLQGRFPNMSDEQIAIVTFYALGEAGRLEGLDSAPSGAGFVNIDSNEMASLRLQMAMDRRSRVMTMLSDMLKNLEYTSSAIVQNIK